MTGEITLRGKVLPVGGIKEKLLAAYRAGITTIVLPKENEKDLDDLPEEIRTVMEFHLVDDVDEVVRLTLEGAPSPMAPEGRSRPRPERRPRRRTDVIRGTCCVPVPPETPSARSKAANPDEAPVRGRSRALFTF